MNNKPETKKDQTIRKFQHKLKEMSNKILKNKTKNKYKGQFEYLFLMLINGFIFSWTQKKDYFILPSTEFIAEIIGCTKSWIAKLIKKHSKLLKIECVEKCNLNNEQLKFCHHKNFVWMAKKVIRFIFNEINIFFFKTKLWKTNCSDNNQFENVLLNDYGLNI